MFFIFFIFAACAGTESTPAPVVPVTPAAPAAPAEAKAPAPDTITVPVGAVVIHGYSDDDDEYLRKCYILEEGGILKVFVFTNTRSFEVSLQKKDARKTSDPNRLQVHYRHTDGWKMTLTYNGLMWDGVYPSEHENMLRRKKKPKDQIRNMSSYSN